jgi:nucleotide-binding universal stress UspA family protein
MSVLISYIPTPEGWAALELGTREAALRATSVVIVNVAVGNDFADITYADEKDLDGVRNSLAAATVGYEMVQLEGVADVADAVLTAAAARDVDLIVVGLRRRSPVGKALLGSNAQRIILSAECPVLSVRPAS